MTDESALVTTGTSKVADAASASVSPTTTVFLWGRPVQMIREPSCIVCKSPFRDDIEMMLYQAWTLPAIIAHLPDDCSVVMSQDGSTKAPLETIRSRFNRHLGKKDASRCHSAMEVAVANQIQEFYAEQAGHDLAGVSLVTSLGVVNDVLRRGFEGMQQNPERPSIKDTLRAAELDLRYRETVGAVHASVFQDGIAAFMKVLGKYVDEDTLSWIYADLNNEPAILEAFKAAELEPAT